MEHQSAGSILQPDPTARANGLTLRLPGVQRRSEQLHMEGFDQSFPAVVELLLHRLQLHQLLCQTRTNLIQQFFAGMKQ